MSRVVMVVAVVIVLLIAAVAAYYLTSTTTTSTSSSTTSTTSTGPAVIRVGILEPLTGFASEYGITATLAAQYAASQINTAGGIHGMQIEIFSADEGSGGTQTINAFNELYFQDHVNLIIGPDFSGDLETILPLIVKYHVITISPSNAIDELHNLIGKNNATAYSMYKYYFTMIYNATFVGKAAVDDFAIPLHATSVYITGEDYLFAHEIGNGTATEAQAQGIQVVGQSYFPGDALDFSSQIVSIGSLKPSVIVLITTGSDEETFIKQLKQNPVTMNIPLVAIGPGDLNDPKIVNSVLQSGTNLDHIAILSGGWYTMNFTGTQAFVQGWKSDFGIYPNIYTEGTTFDALNMFAQAVNTTGSLDPNQIATALEGMTYYGVTGTIKFNSQNAVSFPPYALSDYEFLGNKIQVFWPPSIAQGPYLPPPGYTWTPPS